MSMQCYIYKSQRTEGAYVYLRDADAFNLVPAGLAEKLGTLTFVIELDLSPERKLACEDVNAVMANLQMQGFHLQLPRVVEALNASLC